MTGRSFRERERELERQRQLSRDIEREYSERRDVARAYAPREASQDRRRGPSTQRQLRSGSQAGGRSERQSSRARNLMTFGRSGGLHRSAGNPDLRGEGGSRKPVLVKREREELTTVRRLPDRSESRGWGGGHSKLPSRGESRSGRTAHPNPLRSNPTDAYKSGKWMEGRSLRQGTGYLPTVRQLSAERAQKGGGGSENAAQSGSRSRMGRFFSRSSSQARAGGSADGTQRPGSRVRSQSARPSWGSMFGGRRSSRSSSVAPREHHVGPSSGLGGSRRSASEARAMRTASPAFGASYYGPHRSGSRPRSASQARSMRATSPAYGASYYPPQRYASDAATSHEDRGRSKWRDSSKVPSRGGSSTRTPSQYTQATRGSSSSRTEHLSGLSHGKGGHSRQSSSSRASSSTIRAPSEDRGRSRWRRSFGTPSEGLSSRAPSQYTRATAGSTSSRASSSTIRASSKSRAGSDAGPAKKPFLEIFTKHLASELEADYESRQSSKSRDPSSHKPSRVSSESKHSRRSIYYEGGSRFNSQSDYGHSRDSDRRSRRSSLSRARPSPEPSRASSTSRHSRHSSTSGGASLFNDASDYLPRRDASRGSGSSLGSGSEQAGRAGQESSGDSRYGRSSRPPISGGMLRVKEMAERGHQSSRHSSRLSSRRSSRVSSAQPSVVSGRGYDADSERSGSRAGSQVSSGRGYDAASQSGGSRQSGSRSGRWSGGGGGGGSGVQRDTRGASFRE